MRGSPVALLAEGVDRNVGNDDTINNLREVALLAEGVDRNELLQVCSALRKKSPSSRRAWIEIRKVILALGDAVSPSSRRAWIEMRGREDLLR